MHDLILEILFFKGMAGQARWWAYANHTTRCRLDPILVQPSPAGVTLLCGQFAFNASAVLTGDDDGCVAVYGLRGFEPHPYDQVTVAALMHYRCQFCSYVASQLRDMLQMSQLNLCVADFRCFYGNYLKACRKLSLGSLRPISLWQFHSVSFCAVFRVLFCTFKSTPSFPAVPASACRPNLFVTHSHFGVGKHVRDLAQSLQHSCYLTNYIDLIVK